MGTQQFSLKWKNHQRNMLTTFERLLSNETLVDVTLACEGLSLKAHKMVLSASSPFFQNLFLENPCKHPIVIMKDVKFAHLKAIVEFVYRGEVSVPQDQLTTLLKTAETLKIRGLADLSDDDWQLTGTDQENEKYYYAPLVSSNVQTQVKTSPPDDSNVSDNEDMNFSRTQEQNLPSVISLEQAQNETFLNCELSVTQSQAASNYSEFCGSLQSQLALPCSTFQEDGKITNYKSTKHISHENSSDPPSLDLSLQSTAQLNISSPAGISKQIKQEPGTCNNQILLPHLVGLLSEPYTQSQQVSQGENLSFPSTSTFGNTGNEESDDSYLDYHDTNSLPSQNASSRNNVLGSKTVVTGQRNDHWKLSKKIKDCAQTMNKRLSSVERPFSCGVCGKRFTQKSNLQMHQQTHSGNKPNKCEICGTRFTRSRDLARHHLIHTGEKPFECGTCGKKFNRNSHVRRHERLVHRQVVLYNFSDKDILKS